MLNFLIVPLSDYPSWELEPRNLREDQIANPMLVIHSLFDFAHLPEIREMLWDMLRTTVTGNFGSLLQQEKNDLLYLYEQLEKIVEAIHILHRQDSDRRD